LTEKIKIAEMHIRIRGPNGKIIFETTIPIVVEEGKWYHAVSDQYVVRDGSAEVTIPFVTGITEQKTLDSWMFDPAEDKVEKDESDEKWEVREV